MRRIESSKIRTTQKLALASVHSARIKRRSVRDDGGRNGSKTTGFEQRRRGGNAENSHLSCRNVLRAKIVARIHRGRTWRERGRDAGRQGCAWIIKRTHQLPRHSRHPRVHCERAGRF